MQTSAAARSGGAVSGDVQHLWRCWILAMMAGELVGFIAPAAAGATAFALGMPDAVLYLMAVAGGVVEGAVLGYAQTRVLRTALPLVSTRQWIIATAAAAAVGWSIGMLPGMLWGFLEDHLVVFIAGAIVLGPVLLNAIGVAQWIVLRPHVAAAWMWIPANALGWLLGLTAIIAVMSLTTEDTPAALAALLAVCGAVLMGFIVATVTGGALIRLAQSNALSSSTP